MPFANAQQTEQQEEYSFIDKWDSEGSEEGQLDTHIVLMLILIMGSYT